ncbi:MAG: hypothetical protein ACJ71K_15550 [Nitrososphaeraceae archaeon]
MRQFTQEIHDLKKQYIELHELYFNEIKKRGLEEEIKNKEIQEYNGT